MPTKGPTVLTQNPPSKKWDTQEVTQITVMVISMTMVMGVDYVTISHVTAGCHSCNCNIVQFAPGYVRMSECECDSVKI